MSARTHLHGFSSRDSRRDNANQLTTIRDTGDGSAKPAYISQTDEQCQSYEEIKAHCVRSRTLWEDPDFKPVASSIYFQNPPSCWPNITWKRPREICSNPQLYVDGVSRMDVVQGILGDCWLLAAVASLSTNQKLLEGVLLPDQSFDDNYAGIFRFEFWQYGRWVEVLIDDKLPTHNDKLIYMHSETTNEFWSALLEKAYAKLNGSYEALSGGLTSEALTDFTGGFVEKHDLGPKIPQYMFQLMLKAQKKGALMGCSITPTNGKIEGELKNGLITGHAYSITDVRSVNTRRGQQVSLVRVRNPWGDSHEWKGAWCDEAAEWDNVSQEDKDSMGLTFEPDGEFWMSFEDFTRNYDQLEICYMGPDSVDDLDLEDGQVKWEGVLFEDGWRKRVSAGGCRNSIATFWTNPQYRVTVVDPDREDDNGHGTILVGLMQKDRRKMKRDGLDNLCIGYAIYRAPDAVTERLDKHFFQTHESSAKSSNFIDTREVTEHHKLHPGHYVIVPSTFDPDQEGEFILRIFSEQRLDHAHELNDVTHMVDVKPHEHLGGYTEHDREHEEAGKAAFDHLAGPSGEIDAHHLQNILNKVYPKELIFDGFSMEMTRSMVAMRDTEYRGTLGFHDFKRLWADLMICKKTFMSMDPNRNGYFECYQLRAALSSLGFRVTNATFNGIVIRHSNALGRISFNEFVQLYIRLKTLFESFRSEDPLSSGRVRFTEEEFMLSTMYA